MQVCAAGGGYIQERCPRDRTQLFSDVTKGPGPLPEKTVRESTAEARFGFHVSRAGMEQMMVPGYV